jgi:succinyl-diaminopimelate desuccinylase
LDKGNKHFQASNLEITAISVDNKVHNVIPGRAKTQFNIRYNNLHSSVKLKRMIISIVRSICKKNKTKFKINFLVSGESFLTRPGPTVQMAKRIIKKITKVNTVFSTTGGTSDARFIKKIAPCLEFGLVNKTMHKVDECVSLKDLSNLKKIYNQILEEYFN